MFAYYLDLAWRSLKRTPILTALMVLAIGLGIGASMTMITVLHVMTGDPLPGRSAHLYTPHLDPLPLTYDLPASAPDPRSALTWPDAMALLRAHKAVRQAAMAGGELLVLPQRVGARPFEADGRYTTSAFFSMFGVPFLRGSGWSAADDANRAHVVVLSERMAERLFGATDAIGKNVGFRNIDNKVEDFRVVGVTRHWAPSPLFYSDTTEKLYSASDAFFLPLSVAQQSLAVSNNIMGWGGSGGSSWRNSPDVSWLQFWVQLDTPAQVGAYRRFLVNYSAEQKALGRFQRSPTNARLYSLMGWLAHENLVPDDVRLQFWLAIGFLAVAMLNVVALLLAKFLRRSGEISVRRAMGARRRDIFLQFGIESALIGVAGGLLGLCVAQIGLWTIRQRSADYAHLAAMDPALLAGTVGLAIAVTVLAGLLPAWRACAVPPALHLKMQ
ncbi:MAG TPA: ABC transporter permease [Rhodanobacteraceae bacterium]